MVFCRLDVSRAYTPDQDVVRDIERSLHAL